MGANEPQRKENGHVQRDNNLEQGGGVLYPLKWWKKKSWLLLCNSRVDSHISVVIRREKNDMTKNIIINDQQ